ncbi:hypothetical protein DL96DRAFT_1617361 [Flagelloscypha sp. PMI_526]|nr:hypothetical protein DL96DRAFT_1617361 [Flagelloscypha sp. PMI_526]
MVSLPSDLYFQIFSSLSPYELEICCLVSRDFHIVAQQLLFSNLNLSPKTWKLRCRFLLGSEGNHLCRSIRKLSLSISGLPHSMPHELTRLLETVAPRLQCLTIHGGNETTASSAICWKDISEDFLLCLSTSAFPCIRRLRMFEVADIPLLSLLGNCPLVQNVELSSMYGVITFKGENILNKKWGNHLPNVSSISMGYFGEPDFEQPTSLTKYIAEKGERITFFELGEYYNGEFPAYLSCLEMFDGLLNNLLHLSFGLGFYRTRIQDVTGGTMLPPFPHFPRLETLSFSLGEPSPWEKWDSWFTWMTYYLELPRSLTPCLQVIRFSSPHGNDVGKQPQPSSFNRLAFLCPFSLEFILPGGTSPHSPAHFMADLIRLYLPSWNDEGKLSFWFRYEVD